MKWHWKILIGICFAILLLVVINLGLNLWIKFQLPKIINRENESVYSISYKNVSVSLWKGNITANGIIIVPKAALNDSINKARIYAKVKTIKVREFKIWELVFNDKIKAKSITVDYPQVNLYQKKYKDKMINSVVASFEKVVSVKDIFIKHGNFKIINSENYKPVLTVSNINLNIGGILITNTVLDDKIPFKFRNYALRCENLYYHPNEFYKLKIKKITTTKSDLKIYKFEMLPAYSRKEFVTIIPKEKDLYAVLCDSITINKINWGFNADDFFFHCNTVSVNNAAANIYRSKEPPDDLTKKFLCNKLLRDLKFSLKVDTLKVRNSILEYEEEKSIKLGSGKLTLNAFNLTAISIDSGFKKVKLPDLVIKIKCSFMNTSPLNIFWKLNVLDKTDGFNIKGTLTNFDVKNITPFSKPHLSLTAKGIIEEVNFNFTGNDNKNQGELAVKYDDLKFTIYKKDDPKKKNKLLTFVARIFVKKDTKDEIKNTYIDIERTPDKSFYNLLWRSIAEGLKKILV